jgi:hypothetical protein
MAVQEDRDLGVMLVELAVVVLEAVVRIRPQR